MWFEKILKEQVGEIKKGFLGYGEKGTLKHYWCYCLLKYKMYN